jgi:ABC-2 type transport system ATP-binding protein
MIKINELSKSYNSYTKIFHHLNLEITPGAYYLKGPNGSGKSTLLKIIAGMDSDYTGDISIAGNEMRSSLLACKRNTTFLPDAPEFYKGTPASELIRIICLLRKVDPEVYLNRFARVFNIEQCLHQPVESLSLGQRKKVFLCATLIQEIPIWLLDEPTNGLDSVSIDVLTKEIIEHAKTGVVIFSSHHEGLIARTSARILSMDQLTTVRIFSSLPSEEYCK